MNCAGCAYERILNKRYTSGCKAFSTKPKKCWNYTTQEEAEIREIQITEYEKQATINNYTTNYGEF